MAIHAVGCSDDEGGDPKRESGTCDETLVDYICIEIEGTSDAITDEQEICSDVGGTWTTEPCPTANLVGCCSYEFGGSNYRECNYTGHPDSTPEESCMFWDGTWSPGG